jgi:hypothetical protein
MSLTSHQKEMVIGLVQMKINENEGWVNELEKSGIVDLDKPKEMLQTLYRLRAKVKEL